MLSAKRDFVERRTSPDRYGRFDRPESWPTCSIPHAQSVEPGR